MRWKILKKFTKLPSQPLRIEEIIKILLENRGLKTKSQQEEFLNPKPPDKLNPKEIGLSLVQLKRATERIKKAVKNKEKIIIYGDYDTDGICGTAILWETLYSQGAEVMPFIPKRREGYGLRIERLEEMASNKVSLVITVDQGIVAFKQVERAKELGIEVIITDHHFSEKEKPKALSIIHTSKLSGAGVAWFLARALGNKGGLDLATIGTVADVVPLVGPNRSLVKYGLEEVRKTKRIGLLNLYQKAGIIPQMIDTYHISFIIGPRLNASGRMDDPMDSLRLICTKDSSRAKELAEKIEARNKERQSLTDSLVADARNLWLKSDGKSALIFVYSQKYEEGVIGLVAGKLMEEFYRPVVVLAPREDHWVASARSIEEFNIIEAVRACAEFLGPHGGHPRAAGFSITENKITLVRQRLIDLAETQLKKENLKPTLKIDLELNFSNLTLSLYDQIRKLAPFGEGNPQPVFATRNIWINNAQLVGNENKHLRLLLAQDNTPTSKKISAVGFNMGELYPQLSPDRPVDIAYTLEIDEWNGKRGLQLKIKDIKIKDE